MRTDSALTVQRITKRFNGVVALDDVTLSLTGDKITALIGPNGAGKTTLLDVLSGYTQQDTGRIRLGDQDISSLEPHKIAGLGIGRGFQKIRIIPQMTVLENVLIGFNPQSGERLGYALWSRVAVNSEEKRNSAEALEILGKVGIAEKRDELAGNLSHGQRRLLEIARLLALNPRILLLDEPFSGLSPERVEKMIELIRYLAHDSRSIVFIEHNLPAVMKLAERIIVLDKGKIIADDGPAQIQENPATLRAYLGESHGRGD